MRVLFQRKILQSRENRGFVALWPLAVFAIGLVVFCDLAVTHATAQVTQAGDPAAWRLAWDQMMPVFTHPRCLNCHGGTDPFTGVNHNNGLAVAGPFGFEREDQCTECHSAQVNTANGKDSPWRHTVTHYGGGFAPSFVKGGAAEPPVPKEAAEICTEIVDNVSRGGTTVPGPIRLVNHVQKGALIGLAFAGRRANAIPESDPAEPPPISRGSFLGWATFWVEKAAMACDLNGTITITETLTGSRTLTQSAGPASATITQEESGTRTVNVDVQHGKATVKVEGSGKEETASQTDASGCVTTSTTENTSTSSGSGDGTLRLNLAPGGRHLTINLTGPQETGSQELGAIRMQSCVPGLNTTVPPQQQTPIAEAYPYGIDVPLAPPPKGLITELVGTATQTYKWSASPPSGGTLPWLLYRVPLGPQAGAQGGPPTVTVKIDWNLKLY